MSTIRVGSNKQYAEGWDQVFGGGKKSAAKPAAAKKGNAKKATAKKSAKKK
jgi:hypothetical protein